MWIAPGLATKRQWANRLAADGATALAVSLVHRRTGAASPDWEGVAVEGSFASLDTLWEQPVDRTVFGLLRSFGLAEQASLVAPRPLAVLDSGWP
jgi:hypothetical protein